MISQCRFRVGMLIFISACIILNPFFPSFASDAKTTERQGISIKEAILRALENNQAFHIERVNPEIRKTYESEEKAAFDTTFTFDSSQSKSTLASGIVDLTKNQKEKTAM